MNTLNYEQDLAEKLVELGSQLRQVREDKLMSLEQVAAKTMIQRRLLNAIEEGRLDQLPEPVYTRGFIHRFAEALDLNGAEFVKAFPASRIQRQESDWTLLPTTQLRPIHLYLLYVVLIVAAGSGLSYLVNRSPLKISTTQASVQSGTPTIRATASSLTSAKTSNNRAGPKGTSTPIQTAKSTLVAASVQVSVAIQQESWLEIVADDKTEFAGVLPSGTKRTWTADQKIVVRSGNAGGVLVTYDNAQAPLGKLGAVEEKTFEAKGDAAPQPAVRRQ